MNIKNGASISYTLDASDRVESVSANWLPFAMANGASDLTPVSMIGKPIWSFIGDGETASLWRKIMAEVRAEGIAVTAPFRCDSPTERRFMEISVRPAKAKHVAVRTRMLGQEDRPYLELPQNTRQTPTAHTKVCSWCRRIELPDGDWSEIEDAIARMQHMDRNLARHARYGVCPECMAVVPGLFRSRG